LEQIITGRTRATGAEEDAQALREISTRTECVRPPFPDYPSCAVIRWDDRGLIWTNEAGFFADAYTR
jgi:hypothetical protein